MGVADNKSYKNEYPYFSHTFGRTKVSEAPSVAHDPAINTTIKKNPYRSNVNIEKDEIVLEPDLSAIFKASGKKHSGGGIDVMLKPNSFVFSDDKSLAISKKEKELFELKEGGKWTPLKNTPAEVLRKNIDMKHYNRLVNNIKDVNQDDLAKKSSAMMLEKYIDTLGNIAYIQESKKGLPDGQPEFSNGTAPVYDAELKGDIMKQKQFAKYGGKIRTYAPGGIVGDPECPCGRDANGKCLPCPDESKWQPYIKSAKQVNTAPTDYNEVYSNLEGNLYQKYNQGNPYNVPKGVGSSGVPVNDPRWMAAIQKMIDKGATPEQLVQQGHINQAGVKLFKWPAPQDNFAWLPKTLPGPNIDTTNGTPAPDASNPYVGINVPEVTGDASGVKRADWQFTPLQKMSQAYNLSQLAGAKRYMPLRSRYNASYAQAALLNPEQTIGDLKGVANQQTDALSTLSPILRNAQASSIYGNVLNQIPQVRSQYDNNNVQIQNQNRQYNNQIKNQETLTNMGNDQQYYQQVITGLQNFDNMKSFLSDKYMNNVARDAETNQSLAYSLLTQNNPAYGFDWKTGNFTRNKKSILDAQVNPQADYVTDLLRDLMPKFDSLDPRVQAALLKTAALKNLPMMSYKKGGKTRNPYS